MLASHRDVKKHGAYTVFLRDPGFEFVPGMLGKVASFIVRRRDGEWSVFAFMYSMLIQQDGIEIDEPALLDLATDTILDCLKDDTWRPRIERTFEFRPDTFVEVDGPAWWVPTAG